MESTSSTLDQLAGVDGHVVPQVVEAELVVGAVGDIRLIGGLLGRTHDPVDDQAHGQAHEAVHLAHPLAVALCQVVVDGDDVDALSGQGVEVSGQGGYQGLAFTGLHFGDTALVKDDAADELDPVGAHAQHPPGRLPAGSKGLGQDIVQRLTVLETLLKFGGLGLQLLVCQGLVLLLQRFDLIHQRRDGLDFALGGGPEDFSK